MQASLSALIAVPKLPTETLAYLASGDRPVEGVAIPGIDSGFDPMPFARVFTETFLGVSAVNIAHEIGHRLLAAVNNVKLGPSLNVPNGSLGSFGAVTPAESPYKTRKELFDVAFAGPLFGTIVAGSLFIYGLMVRLFFPGPARDPAHPQQVSDVTCTPDMHRNPFPHRCPWIHDSNQRPVHARPVHLRLPLWLPCCLLPCLIVSLQTCMCMMRVVCVCVTHTQRTLMIRACGTRVRCDRTHGILVTYANVCRAVVDGPDDGPRDNAAAAVDGVPGQHRARRPVRCGAGRWGGRQDLCAPCPAGGLGGPVCTGAPPHAPPYLWNCVLWLETKCGWKLSALAFYKCSLSLGVCRFIWGLACVNFSVHPLSSLAVLVVV